MLGLKHLDVFSTVSSHDSNGPGSPFIDVEGLSDDDDDLETTSATKTSASETQMSSQPSTSHSAMERGQIILPSK